MMGPTIDGSLTLLFALGPVLLLVMLVLRSRWSTATDALITTSVSIVIGAIAFAAGPTVLGVAVGKGMWTGLWILYVIWPALLLFQITSAAGLTRMGQAFSSILPRDIENVLIVAWILPSFVQGVAGFGTPIAVSAPLLLAMGYGPVRAVGLPLVGYHWSVTFGSMASSFYMGALTAGLDRGDLLRYGLDAGIILTVNMLIAGVLVCLLHGGIRSLRRGWRVLATVGPLMGITLIGAVQVEPPIGSLAAGAAGLLGVVFLRIATGREMREIEVAAQPIGADGLILRPAPSGTASSGNTPPPRAVVVLLPYLLLLVLVLAVFVPATSREVVKSTLLVGPSFPATETGAGFATSAVSPYNPIALLGHPGTYILASAILGVMAYRWLGAWPAESLEPTLRRWLAQARRSTLSVVALTTLATVMVDTGMVRTIATGAAALTGSAFPTVSPIVGAVGSLTTGSTTTSNALFSALQHDVGVLIDVHPSELVAAQTAGGNVGNAVAPVVILIGAAAVDAGERVGEILRSVMPAVAVLIAGVVLSTWMIILAR